MTLQPPFALFVLSDDFDTEYINYSLRRAWRGNFMAGWDFWIATDSHGDIPKNSDDQAQGTVAPIRGSFTSPWVGKSLRDCANWLLRAPADIAVNRQYFTAMDEHSKGDDTLLVCRVVRSAKSGDVDVEYFPQGIDSVASHMTTNGDAKFDEKALSYQRARQKAGKPVRSKTASWH